VNDKVEKRIELKASVSRVWRALTDYREFGEWFRVKLDGPFVPGEVSRGYITWPGLRASQMGGRRAENGARAALFLHLASVFNRSQNRLLEGDAHAGRIQAGERPRTGTLLLLTESGFDKIPSDRLLEAFRRNDEGWTQQMKNIEAHVEQKP